jgi:D-amino-acid dehydrogenase
MSTTRHAVVVGAGIVGICTAIELRRQGLRVTVLDRLEPGQGCSFGNAGILAAQAVVPIGLPGAGGALSRMLFDAESPLSLPWASLLRWLPWLLRMRRASSLQQVARIADAMKALYGSTLELHQALAKEAGVPELIQPTPGLYVHRDTAGIDLERGLAWRLRRERGAHIEVLVGAALREAEPDLSPEYTSGVRMGAMGCTVNPLRLVQAYAALLVRMGGSVQRASVSHLQPQPTGTSDGHGLGDGVIVHTSAGPVRADVAVVAAGAWSVDLLKPLGLSLPLIAERGYHVTFGDPGIRLNHVVTEIEAHFACTSMEIGLRVAGTEELGGPDDAPRWRRAEVLQRQARRLFPAARLAQASRWMGPRPGLPDSLPAIGPIPGQARIFVATGHGHLGLTGAPHTGQLVAQLVAGTRSAQSLVAYAPGRFGG